MKMQVVRKTLGAAMRRLNDYFYYSLFLWAMP